MAFPFLLSRRVVLAKITASYRKSLRDYVPPSALTIFVQQNQSPDSFLSTKSIFFTFASGSTAKLAHRVLYMLRCLFNRLIMDGISPGGPHPIATSVYTCQIGIISPHWCIVYHDPLRPMLCGARKSLSSGNEHSMQFDPSTTIHFVDL